MTDTAKAPGPAPCIEEVLRDWNELSTRVRQLQAENAGLHHENKELRTLLERVIEHRQRSHNELVLLLTNLVSRLPLNDVGVFVSQLVEHNTSVSHYLAALAKGAVDTAIPQPVVLQTLDQAKRELLAEIQPLVAELLQLEVPIECGLLNALPTDPESAFSPRFLRASRCFVKGQVARERILREFGDSALALCNDMTTDPKLNPRPKPDEIMLGFKNDFETLLAQNTTLAAEKRQELAALYRRVQQSKATSEQARRQRNVFYRLSFIVELLHYYEHQNTEPADVIFAQRLPAIVEQLVLVGPHDTLEEALVVQAEALMAHVINPDHRQMIVNNVGKGSPTGKTLRYVLRLRAEKVPDLDHVIAEFLRHLVPQPKPPASEPLVAVLRLVPSSVQASFVKALVRFERLRKDDAVALGRTLAEQLKLPGIEQLAKAQEAAVPPEVERQIAWAKIKDLIARRSDPVAIASAIRERLHARYDADEIRQSWITLIEADPLALIRIFCHLPYLPNGTTDSIARPVMETYISRLTHEKYAATYHKVINSLRNMFHAKPDSPILTNFTALVRWVSPEAAAKISADAGMSAPAH